MTLFDRRTTCPRNPGLVLALLALTAGTGLAQDGAGSSTGLARIERRVAAMGTDLVLQVTAQDRPTALSASEDAVRAIEAVEARLSTWREGSELSRLNRTPVGARFEPSAPLARDLARVLRWREETAGAFTPTGRALVEAWSLRTGGRRPGVAELQDAIAACAPAAMRFELPAGVTRLATRVGIEEGGFGKGVALDEAAEALRSAGVAHAYLDFGGQALVVGDLALVELAHPDQRDRGVVRLDLRAGSSATSGNSERGVEVDGQRLGHILDPRTGQPARDFGSLTVCATSATDADCLSTALYVLGPDAALRFADEHPALDVIVLERGENELRARASLGLRDRITPLTPGLEIEWYVPPATPTGAPSAAPAGSSKP